MVLNTGRIEKGGAIRAVIYARVSSGMQADLGIFKDTKDENLLK